MKWSCRLALGAVVFLVPFQAQAQQIQIESVSGQDAAAHEILFKLQPWAPGLSQVIQPYDAETVQQIGRGGFIRLKSRSLDASALLAAFRLDPQIASPEPNYIVHTTDTVPNDPSFGSLWGMQNTGQVIQGQAGVPFADISAVKAWDVARGSTNVAVGVVDTGVDYTHPDLAANIWTAQTPYQIVLGGITYTCPVGSHGFNAEKLTCDPMDDNTHGTHVSGTIGAQGNNLLGVTGVNWKTSIVGFKFLDMYGFGSVADAINAIEAAIQMKAQGVNIRVLSNSWGFGIYSDSLLQALNEANANDLLFVAAAGNNSSNNDQTPAYPATYNLPNIISVAATDNQDHLASFSDYGPTTVHLGAPGVNVLSTFLSPNYGYLSGTSMATPHVSGAAALVLSKCTLNTADLKTAILNSVDPIASLAGITVTGGRLNVYHALTYCGATASPDFTMSASPAVLSVAPGGSAPSQISVVDFGGFSDTVKLSVSGVPSGVTASFSQTSIPGAGNVMLTLKTAANTVPQTYPITVLGSGGGVTSRVVVELTVSPPDFTLSAAPTSLSVTAGSSVTSMVTAAALNGFGGAVTLTANGLPSGVTASFTSNPLAGSGTSTLTLAAAANTTPGTYQIAITGASGTTLSHTVTVNLTVNAAPDFTLSASPSSVSALAGNSVGSTLTISALNAFSGAVTLTASGMPTGVTATFVPGSVTASGTSVVTLATANSTAAGVYSISIQATSGNLMHNVTVSLTVLAPDFTISASPAAFVLPPGGSATSTIAIGALNGFAGPVNLTASALPAGVTASFSPPAVNGSGGSTLTFQATAVAPVGVFNVSVQGVSGTLSHVAGLSVTLQPSLFLPVNVSVLPGSSVPFPVTLGAPATTSVFVSLTSSDPSKVTVTPASFLIPPGATTSPFTPRLTGVNFGQASITASAWNYATATQPVQVVDSLSFYPNSLTLSQGASQILTLTLQAPLPAVTVVNLTSDNVGVATLPPSVTFPVNTTSVTLRVTGVFGGSTTIHASASPAIPDATASISVAPALAISTTALSNGRVNSVYSQSLSATGGLPPLTWTLISGALPTGLTLSPSGQINGTPAVTATNTPLTFRVTDAGSPQQTAIATLTLTIVPSGPSPASIAPAKGTPQSTTVNTAFSIPLTAVVKDSGGNPLSGVSVSFTAPATGATGSFATGASTTVVTDATGSAAANFSANTVAGLYTVNASVAGVAAPASFLLTNVAGPPAHISATSGNSQSAAINAGFSSALVATVTDANGNPAGGVKVTFLAPASGASGSFAGGTNVVTTDTSGRAAAPLLTANGIPGSYSVTASVSGVTALASFSLTNIGPPASVIAVSAGGQSASISSPFPNPLVAKVQDAAGNPVSGVTVTFAAPGSGASGIFSGSNMVATNASGIATSPTFTANSIGGTYQVSATVGGVVNPATFSLTNLSGIILPSAITVTPGLSTPYMIALGAPAPAGGVYIGLTSSNPSILTVTPLNILVPAGSTTPTVIPRINGINLGSATMTATAYTYQPVSQQVAVTDGLNASPASATISTGAVQYVTLTLAAPIQVSLPVTFTSDNPAVVAAPSTVAFPANSTSLTVRLTGLATGSATITASSPPNVAAVGISVTVR